MTLNLSCIGRLTAAALCLSLIVTATPARARAPQQPVSIPQEATALEGTPEVRVEITKEGTVRRTLDASEAARSRLLIKVVDGRLFWGDADRPLTVSSSGAFTYLSSSEPGRYVRFRRVNDRLTYVEHVDMELGSVTYWGELRIVLGK